MDHRYSQPDSIPPLPSNAHSHSNPNSFQQPQRATKPMPAHYQPAPAAYNQAHTQQHYVPQGHAQNHPVQHTKNQAYSQGYVGPTHGHPPSHGHAQHAPHNQQHVAQHVPQHLALAQAQQQQQQQQPTARNLPYPVEDSMGISLQQHAQQHPTQARHQVLHHQQSNSQLAAQTAQAQHRPLPFLRQAPSRHFGHGRSDSAGSISSFRSNRVDAKPAPKRHYIWENSSPKNQLSINQFEAIRRAASQRPHEPTVQLEYAKKLVEASHQLASRYSDPFTPSSILCDKKTEQKNREVWTTTALKITKKVVSRANLPDAVFFLALNYSSGGMGLDVDNVKAFELYNKAAKNDHPEACYRVAVCHELGVGTKIDTERAFSWYKKAAPLNDVKSMYKLGMTYLNGGLCQQRNFKEALMWLQRAAEKADTETPHAVHQLGLIFENARDAPYEVQRDLTRAFDYFSRAASLGYSPAQVRLGRAHEFGELDRSVDSSKAMEWYTVAAQAGDSDAELGLCGFHWTGIDGVLRANDTEAFLWAERAAQKSNARAEFALGVFYQLGVGVPVDLEKARQMFARAHEKRHPHALQRLRECERG